MVLFFMICLMAGGQLHLFSQQSLDSILEGAAAYCQKLKQEVFHFACDEIITASGKEKVKYNSLYQIIKIGDRIKEKRTLIRQTKKRTTKKEVKISTKLYSYQGALTPILLLSAENQKNYQYLYLKKEKVLGRWAHLLEVRLKTGLRKGVLAVHIWIDRSDYSVLRSKVFPEAVTGFDHIITYAQQRGLKYTIKDIHDFGFTRNGIRFPTKTEINIELTQEDSTVSTQNGFLNYTAGRVDRRRIKTVYKYKNYMFFKVDVSRPVFKVFKKSAA